MTEKTKPTKKPQTQKTKESEETKTISLLLNKILICLYAIIMILVVNTTLLVLNGVSTSSTNKEETAEEVDYDVSMFKTITDETFASEVESDEAKIVYIGRSTCGYCVKFLPVLQQAQKDYKYETLYLDITTITTVEQKDRILAFDNEEEFLSQKFGGTPMVLLMKSGKIVDVWMGYAEYSEYASWLEKNGFAK